MEMRTLTIAAIVASLAMPAYAQKGPAFSKPGTKTDAEKAAEEKQRKAEEKAYKDSVSRVPDKEQKFDPWGNMR